MITIKFNQWSGIRNRIFYQTYAATCFSYHFFGVESFRFFVQNIPQNGHFAHHFFLDQVSGFLCLKEIEKQNQTKAEKKESRSGPNENDAQKCHQLDYGHRKTAVLDPLDFSLELLRLTRTGAAHFQIFLKFLNFGGICDKIAPLTKGISQKNY